MFATRWPLIPDLADRKMAEDRHQAVQVIRMRVGEDHQVQVADPAGEKERDHHLLPDVESIVEQPATVDQDGPLSWKLHDNRVALTNVEDRHPHPAVPRDGNQPSGDQDDKGQRGRKREPSQPAASERDGSSS